MAENNNERSFIEIEDELNIALGKIGEKKEEKIEEKSKNDERVSALTVQELLEQLKIDEFEKMYITTATQSNSPNNEQIPEEKMDQVRTLAEYQLSQKDIDEAIGPDEQKKLKSASNFYLIPHTVNQRYNVGNIEQTKTVDLYTVNDVEGYSLYNIIDNQNISLSTGARERIKKYLEETYPIQVEMGTLSVDEVVEHFTPNNMEDLYNILGNESIISMRFLPIRIDEYAHDKGIIIKDTENKSLHEKFLGYDKQEEQASEEQVEQEEDSTNTGNSSKDKPEIEVEQKLEEDEGETLEEPDLTPDKVKDGASIKLKEDEEEKNEKVETYVEKIARLNHVKPAVVNTRVVENFEKVEEDTGIPLKGRYPRGEVIAVRIPYKLGYRTFLVEKSTGMTIDGKGRMDRKPGKLYDFDEIEDYFRFKLRDGHDGGENGKPLRADEERDYTTYLDANGEIKEEKFINNGKEKDMLRDERERYLAEVADADNRLKEAIEEYQKHATKENYKKVRDIIQEKVNIDNKYNALDEQREITEKTKENAEQIIQRDLDEDDDEWYPGSGRFYR